MPSRHDTRHRIAATRQRVTASRARAQRQSWMRRSSCGRWRLLARQSRQAIVRGLPDQADHPFSCHGNKENILASIGVFSHHRFQRCWRGGNLRRRSCVSGGRAAQYGHHGRGNFWNAIGVFAPALESNGCGHDKANPQSQLRKSMKPAH